MEGGAVQVQLKEGAGWKKRSLFITHDALEILKDGRFKKSLPRTTLHGVTMCGNRVHKNCIALDAGSESSMHIKLEREHESGVVFTLLCEMVAHNKNAVKVAAKASSQKMVGETADDADLLAAVFGGSGLGTSGGGSSASAADGPPLPAALSAHYPVILIPGLASSALDVVKSPDNVYVGKRVWIGLGSLAAGKMFSGSRKKKDRSARKAAKDAKGDGDDDDGDDIDVLALMLGGAGRSLTQLQSAPASGELRSENRWLRHICLHESRDGFSDPVSIFHLLI
jgi:hypothetical protein